MRFGASERTGDADPEVWPDQPQVLLSDTHPVQAAQAQRREVPSAAALLQIEINVEPIRADRFESQRAAGPPEIPHEPEIDPETLKPGRPASTVQPDPSRATGRTRNSSRFTSSTRQRRSNRFRPRAAEGTDRAPEALRSSKAPRWRFTAISRCRPRGMATRPPRWIGSDEVARPNRPSEACENTLPQWDMLEIGPRQRSTHPSSGCLSSGDHLERYRPNQDASQTLILASSTWPDRARPEPRPAGRG